MMKAVIFDIGHTLVHYNSPLNWQALYPAAIKNTMDVCNIPYTKEADKNAQIILTKYNTRVNYREHEVSSDTIFSEILDAWQVRAEYLQPAKQAFYGYFQQGVKCYEDTVFVLQQLKDKGIKIGILTDVAYGMDNSYVTGDLATIEKYIDIYLTSNDVGYRKPNATGYMMLQKAFDIPCSQIAFVGDEEKDIVGANNVGMVSVLVNRSDEAKDFSQNHTINSLTEILTIAAKGSIT